jgi:hypothetical protein
VPSRPYWTLFKALRLVLYLSNRTQRTKPLLGSRYVEMADVFAGEATVDHSTYVHYIAHLIRYTE